MRLRSYKWVLAVGLVTGGFKVYQSHSELQQWFQRYQSGVEGLAQALPSQVYRLETDRWLIFDIAKDTPLIRLISNAGISPTEKAVPGTQWPYAIDYELRGSQGQTITTGTYHFKGEQLVFLDKQSGMPVDVNFYLERQVSPLGGRRWLLNLKEPTLSHAQLLALRLHSSHADLLEVAVRVYFQSEVPERKIGYLWNRLSEDQQRDLARGNVYSVEGLTDREKQGLLRYRWAAAAPEGILGRDFERRILYIREDSESLEMLKDWMPSGIPVDAEHCGVLPITNASGACQVRIVNYDTTFPTQVVSNTLWWHGERPRIEANQLMWSGVNQTVWASNRDGFLKISSSRPVSVRAFQVEAGETNEITPEPVHVLGFTASPTNSVEYTVAHVGESPTLFRVDVRRFIPSRTANGRVHYSLISSNGGTIQADKVAITNTVSGYDWLVTESGLTNISEPQSLCFELPPTVRTLRIDSPRETVLVNAYSRPSGVVKKILVPEDYSPASSLAPEQPNWFTVLPPDQIRRRRDLQCQLVRVQPRLPEYDPLIQAGQYEWESFLPGHDFQGHMILLPLEEGQPQRPGSMPFSYFSVRVGGEQRLRFQGEAWEREVAPSLMLVSHTGSPGKTTVTVDGQTLLDASLDASVTEVHLGSLTVGEHKVSVRTGNPEVSAYLNFLESATNAAYLQRFCIMASSNALHFPYLKRQTGEELLVLRIFSPVETNPQPFEVHVNLRAAVARGMGPFSELTLMEREARVTPNPLSRTRLVAATPSQLDDGQPLFVRVGPDLPPGQYELEVSIKAQSPRWLSLSRTTPGLVEKLEVASKRRVN